MSINRIRMSGAVRTAIRRLKNQSVPGQPTHSDMAAFLVDAPPDRQTEFESHWNESVARNEQELANSQTQEVRVQPDYVEDLRILVKYPLLSRKVGIPEASRLVGVGQCKFRKLVQAGKIPVIRCGIKMLFHPSDLEKFVESQRVTMTGRRPAPLRRSLPDRVIKSPYLMLNTLG